MQAKISGNLYPSGNSALAASSKETKDTGTLPRGPNASISTTTYNLELASGGCGLATTWRVPTGMLREAVMVSPPVVGQSVGPDSIFTPDQLEAFKTFVVDNFGKESSILQCQSDWERIQLFISKAVDYEQAISDLKIVNQMIGQASKSGSAYKISERLVGDFVHIRPLLSGNLEDVRAFVNEKLKAVPGKALCDSDKKALSDGPEGGLIGAVVDRRSVALSQIEHIVPILSFAAIRIKQAALNCANRPGNGQSIMGADFDIYKKNPKDPNEKITFANVFGVLKSTFQRTAQKVDCLIAVASILSPDAVIPPVEMWNTIFFGINPVDAEKKLYLSRE